MNLLYCFAVATAVVATTCFTVSAAAPYASARVNTPNSLPWNALIEDDPAPDPGIANWFTDIFNRLTKSIASKLADKDPKKFEEIREYIKKQKAFIDPVASFIKQYYPNDVAANNVIGAINTFLSSLEKMVDEQPASHQDFVQNMAFLMHMLETTN